MVQSEPIMMNHRPCLIEERSSEWKAVSTTARYNAGTAEAVEGQGVGQWNQRAIESEQWPAMVATSPALTTTHRQDGNVSRTQGIRVWRFRFIDIPPSLKASHGDDLG